MKILICLSEKHTNNDACIMSFWWICGVNGTLFRMQIPVTGEMPKHHVTLGI